jgi:hypothetical protein
MQLNTFNTKMPKRKAVFLHLRLVLLLLLVGEC